MVTIEEYFGKTSDVPRDELVVNDVFIMDGDVYKYENSTYDVAFDVTVVNVCNKFDRHVINIGIGEGVKPHHMMEQMGKREFVCIKCKNLEDGHVYELGNTCMPCGTRLRCVPTSSEYILASNISKRGNLYASLTNVKNGNIWSPLVKVDGRGVTKHELEDVIGTDISDFEVIV